MSKFTRKGINKEVNQNKKYSKFKIVFVSTVSCLMIVSAFIVYLNQVNSSASKGYLIQELESEISDLNVQNEKLKLRVAEWKSMNKLDERIANLQMVKADEIAYLSSSDNKMAAAK